MIPHLYFFDDLTVHLQRIVRERGGDADREKEVARLSRRYAATLISCLDGALQDCTLIPWEHAVEQLAWLVSGTPEKYDLVVGQGTNGEFALASLDEAHVAQTGAPVAARMENVRIARFLSDSEDPFHSPFELRTTTGPSIEERCAEIIDGLPIGSRSRVAVFDDCIQTGNGTSRIIESIQAALDSSGREATIDTLSFIGCGETLDSFAARGIPGTTAVMLRGQTYPASWDYDVYFLKDFFLPNAIRFTDGTKHSYVDDHEWIGRIFGDDPERARVCIQDLWSSLADLELLDALMEM